MVRGRYGADTEQGGGGWERGRQAVGRNEMGGERGDKTLQRGKTGNDWWQKRMERKEKIGKDCFLLKT